MDSSKCKSHSLLSSWRPLNTAFSKAIVMYCNLTVHIAFSFISSDLHIRLYTSCLLGDLSFMFVIQDILRYQTFFQRHEFNSVIMQNHVGVSCKMSPLTIFLLSCSKIKSHIFSGPCHYQEYCGPVSSALGETPSVTRVY